MKKNREKEKEKKRKRIHRIRGIDAKTGGNIKYSTK